ncbi:MAG: hypothetical protein U1F43_25905 [Myxococcota bacterium]
MRQGLGWMPVVVALGGAAACASGCATGGGPAGASAAAPTAWLGYWKSERLAWTVHCDDGDADEQGQDAAMLRIEPGAPGALDLWVADPGATDFEYPGRWSCPLEGAVASIGASLEAGDGNAFSPAVDSALDVSQVGSLRLDADGALVASVRVSFVREGARCTQHVAGRFARAAADEAPPALDPGRGEAGLGPCETRATSGPDCDAATGADDEAPR